MNKIIFTRDAKNERAWIEQQFPNFINLETRSSGRWNSVFCENLDSNKLYEIAYDDQYTNDQLLNTTLDTYKSVFGPGSLKDKNWCYADKFISNKQFSSFQNLPNPYYIALTFGRCGTEFVETLINKKYQHITGHRFPETIVENQQLLTLIQSTKDITVALIYRKQWWDWVTSMCIGQKIKFYHHYDQVDWNNLPTITIDKDDLDRLQLQLINTWDFYCNMRDLLPSYDFYLLEFETMLKNYSHKSSHARNPYNKKLIISNYEQMEDLFFNSYYNNWVKLSDRCIHHLQTMGCKTNLDNIPL